MNREQRHAHQMIFIRSRPATLFLEEEEEEDAKRNRAKAEARRETFQVIGGGLLFLALIWIVLTLC